MFEITERRMERTRRQNTMRMKIVELNKNSSFFGRNLRQSHDYSEDLELAEKEITFIHSMQDELSRREILATSVLSQTIPIFFHDDIEDLENKNNMMQYKLSDENDKETDFKQINEIIEIENRNQVKRIELTGKKDEISKYSAKRTNIDSILKRSRKKYQQAFSIYSKKTPPIKVSQTINMIKKFIDELRKKTRELSNQNIIFFEKLQNERVLYDKQLRSKMNKIIVLQSNIQTKNMLFEQIINTNDSLSLLNSKLDELNVVSVQLKRRLSNINRDSLHNDNRIKENIELLEKVRNTENQLRIKNISNNEKLERNDIVIGELQMYESQVLSKEKSVILIEQQVKQLEERFSSKKGDICQQFIQTEHAINQLLTLKTEQHPTIDVVINKTFQ